MRSPHPVLVSPQRAWSLLVPVTVAGSAALLGLLASGRTAALPGASATLGLVASLPPAALIAGFGAVALAPALTRHWETATGVLFAWLVVEDLVRKLAGNDLRVYFVKDLFFALAVVALATSGTGLARDLRQATGAAGRVLGVLVVWAVVLSVPTALEDWRIPVVGLRLDFLYVPLVVAGWRIARDQGRLVRWLTGLALLSGIGSLIGVVQAFVGPSFLAPGVPVRGLGNLVLVRGTATSGPVYRPTGTFVDPGRFSSFANVGLALCLAALFVTVGGRRRLVAAATAACGAGVWVSGGRAGFIAAVALIALAVIGGPWALGRPSLSRAGGVVLAALMGLAVLSVTAPELLETRLRWYQETLDPRSPTNEWAFRWRSYSGATAGGIFRGGLVGQGTGRESLGKQYLYEGGDPADAEIYGYQTEGGYAAVAIEWGVVGLALWVTWTAAWLARAHGAVRRRRGDPVAASAVVLVAWLWFFLVIGFFGGLQGFQNYLANAYFWLLSGVVFGIGASTVHDTVGRAAEPEPVVA